MKKQFAVKALKKIKEIHATYFKLKELGVDLIEYEAGTNLLEESIALLLTNDEASFEKALNDVQWWLYEKAKKVITLEGGTKVDVNTPEDFVEWMEDWYK